MLKKIFLQMAQTLKRKKYINEKKLFTNKRHFVIDMSIMFQSIL